MTETIQTIGMRKPFYATYRLILSILAAVWSGIDGSPLPYCVFLLASIALDWLILGKLGYKEFSCLTAVTQSHIVLDDYAIRMMKYRRFAVPLTFILMGCWYLFSKKHIVEYPIPILIYAGLVIGHKVYHLYRYGFLTAYPFEASPQQVPPHEIAFDPQHPLFRHNPADPSRPGTVGSPYTPNQSSQQHFPSQLFS
ncbi:MAG: hypothetical protein K0M45_03185 [Candidatus Paracaedibacteraceae bacterium]|nr:hypothetical protein [Candidatus Paracaedibacteraceae bacterium]